MPAARGRSAQWGLGPEEPRVEASRWFLLVGLVLVLAVGEGASYAVRERQSVERLALANDRLERHLMATRSQMNSLEANLRTLSAPVLPGLPWPARAPWSAVNQTGKANAPAAKAERRPAPLHRAFVEPKWQRQMKQELARQTQQLAAAQEDLARTRSELSSKMASTHGSLSSLGGSIARNHAELVALEQLNQRSYFEFDLEKSKGFERAGPIGVSLRHTNAKRKNYNIVLLVDDDRLEKKNMALYEPIRLETAESSQPLELVVNRIGKNTVHGYVSVPKPIARSAASPGGLSGVPNAGTRTGRAASYPEPSQAGQVALTRRAQPYH